MDRERLSSACSMKAMVPGVTRRQGRIKPLGGLMPSLKGALSSLPMFSSCSHTPFPEHYSQLYKLIIHFFISEFEIYYLFKYIDCSYSFTYTFCFLQFQIMSAMSLKYTCILSSKSLSTLRSSNPGHCWT